MTKQKTLPGKAGREWDDRGTGNLDQNNCITNYPSRLTFYKGCNTPINTDLWARHLKTLRILKEQSRVLGLWEIEFEFSMLIGEHIAAGLRDQLGGHLNDKPQ